MGNSQSDSSSSRKQLKKGQSHLQADGSWNPIPDNYHNIHDVEVGLRNAGLESSNLIFGIDLTKSNESQGRRTFNGNSLHSLSNGQNPYEKSMDVMSRTLRNFDDDGIIPCFGFGCSNTNDRSVLDIGECQGLPQMLARYRTLIPHVKLAGPTSFGPIIRKAVDVVVADNNSYHILVIVADGAITRPSSLEDHQVSQFEQDTMNAIVEASYHPLSIVMVGVGDGPWAQMQEFDDKLPDRQFDNFQFVAFDTIEQEARRAGKMDELDARFALHALMEIPEQYTAILQLNLLGSNNRPQRPNQESKPPPIELTNVHAPSTSTTGINNGYANINGNGGTNNAVPVVAFDQFGTGNVPSIDNLPIAHSVMPVEALQNNVPPLFMCPLSHQIMTNPVQCLDGQTYERTAIEQWFVDRGSVSPIKSQPLPNTQVFENIAIKTAIQQWRVTQQGK